MSLTGITLIKDGNKLHYPWQQCIKSMASYCDIVIVNVGISNDFTEEDVYKLESILDNIEIHIFDWDMSNTGDGRELAFQANNLLKFIETDWILYLQADEFLLESDGFKIKEFLKTVPKEISQLELYRTYFYKDLFHRLPRHELFLGRIFRKDTHQIGGDGMHLIREQGEVLRTKTPIYHYSRIGEPEQITRRIRTLDKLFHSEEDIESFHDFYYNETDLITYTGIHPKGIKEFYK